MRQLLQQRRYDVKNKAKSKSVLANLKQLAVEKRAEIEKNQDELRKFFASPAYRIVMDAVISMEKTAVAELVNIRKDVEEIYRAQGRVEALVKVKKTFAIYRQATDEAGKIKEEKKNG
jgi:hypothetical protein